MFRVPFENLSKLYYKKHRGLRTLPAVELFLDGIEKHYLGGTCYVNNYYLYLLLTNLGYQTMLCGAKMLHPNAHLVSMVDLDNRQYLIDAGYAAPFLQPLPLDLKEDLVILSGADRYLLKPRDKYGYSQLELYRNGELYHGYQVGPEPQRIEDFEATITDSYRDEAAFMNQILIARFFRLRRKTSNDLTNSNSYPCRIFQGRSLCIRDMTLIESSGSESTFRTLSGRGELVQTITDYFGITSPFTDDLPADCC